MSDKLKLSLFAAKAHLLALSRRAEVDRAVLFGVSAKIWGMLAGPVTALLVATKFSPALQGYYYTFGNLLALQVFVELGLGVVIVQFASHEWSKLALDPTGVIAGDPGALARLSSLARVALKWYLAGGVITTLGLGVSGYVFFSGTSEPGVEWAAPWFALSLLTGWNICIIPIWSLLEGCNQVSNLYMYRFFQGVCSSLSIWIAILCGAKLWAASISTAVILICASIFLHRKYRGFLKSLLISSQNGPVLEWRRDIMPLQWRIALSWVSGYFAFSIFTPVLFHYHGPLIAGQFGMTWSIVAAIGSIGNAWVAPKVPQFGMLISRKEFEKLDSLFWRITKITAAITLLLSLCCLGAVHVLNMLRHPLAERLLPPLPAGMLLLAQMMTTLSLPFSSYLRAHKKEPLLTLSVLAGILTGVSTLFLGKHYSANGAVIGYLLVNMIIIPLVVVIWHRCRKTWHITGELFN